MKKIKLTAKIPEVAFKTKRFSVKVEVLYDPFPDKFYRNYSQTTKSAESRYQLFDMLVDHARIMKQTKDVIYCTPLFIAARNYYNSKRPKRR